MVTLYNVISDDGFIARLDGSEDFIPDESWPETLEFFRKFDTLIMGHKTYDAIQEYPEELLRPFEALPIQKVIVTSDATFLPKVGYDVAHSPKEAIEMGKNVVVSSGPMLNNFLLAMGMVKRIVLRKVPQSLNAGIRPFNLDKGSLVAIDYIN